HRFWLDAPWGAISSPLFDISKRIVSTLPGLKAIIFEIYLSFVPIFGLNAIRAQLADLHELWEFRGKTKSEELPVRVHTPINVNTETSPAAWERAVGTLVIGRQSNEDLARELEADPGIGLVNRLICEFRGSMIVNVLRLTARLIMLALGADIFRAILEAFC